MSLVMAYLNEVGHQNDLGADFGITKSAASLFSRKTRRLFLSISNEHVAS